MNRQRLANRAAKHLLHTLQRSTRCCHPALMVSQRLSDCTRIGSSSPVLERLLLVLHLECTPRPFGYMTTTINYHHNDKIQHLTPQIKTVTGWNLLWDSLQWPVARREPTQAATSRKGLPVSATPRKVDSPTCRRLLLPVSFGKSCAFPQSVSHNVPGRPDKSFCAGWRWPES